jgi:hypothetical protein
MLASIDIHSFGLTIVHLRSQVVMVVVFASLVSSPTVDSDFITAIRLVDIHDDIMKTDIQATHIIISSLISDNAFPCWMKTLLRSTIRLWRRHLLHLPDTYPVRKGSRRCNLILISTKSGSFSGVMKLCLMRNSTKTAAESGLNSSRSRADLRSSTVINVKLLTSSSCGRGTTSCCNSMSYTWHTSGVTRPFSPGKSAPVIPMCEMAPLQNALCRTRTSGRDASSKASSTIVWKGDTPALTPPAAVVSSIQGYV